MQKHSDIIKIFIEGFLYSLSFQRVFLFFIASLPLFIYVTIFLKQFAEVLLAVFQDKEIFQQLDINTKILIAGVFLFTALSSLLQLYFRSTITRNCYVGKYVKHEPLYKSIGYVLKSFVNLLIASIIIMVLSWLINSWSSITFLGSVLIFIFTLILSILFFFYVQTITIDNKDWFSGLSSSINLIRKQTTKTLLFILGLLILGLVFTIVATIPIIILFFMFLGTIPEPSMLPQNMMQYIQLYIEFIETNFTLTFIAILVSLFLGSFVMVFQESCKTLYYTSYLKKKITKNSPI